MTDSSPLSRQMAFLIEADRLKTVTRATTLCDGSRFENSAEHSWHIALYAMTLAEHAPEGCDIGKVIQMLLLHDLVEIDAGDAPVFGDHDMAAIEAAEQAAADRIFGLLPAEQGTRFRAIWDEFEANESSEARFAKSIDRANPPVQNLQSGGGSWKDYNVDWPNFEGRIGAKVKRGAPALWAWLAPRAKAMLDKLSSERK